MVIKYLPTRREMSAKSWLRVSLVAAVVATLFLGMLSTQVGADLEKALPFNAVFQLSV